MKPTIKAALIGAWLAAAAAPASAQTPPVVTIVTNMVQTMNFALVATVQSPPTANASTIYSVSISTRNILTLLNTNFSTQAQLLLVTRPGASITDPGMKVLVQDIVNRTNIVFTDVSTNFGKDPWGSVINSTTTSGITTGTRYLVQMFWFFSGPVAFDLFGYGSSSLQTQALNLPVTGVGTVNGLEAIFQGTLSLSAQKAQALPATLTPALRR